MESFRVGSYLDTIQYTEGFSAALRLTRGTVPTRDEPEKAIGDGAPAKVPPRERPYQPVNLPVILAKTCKMMTEKMKPTARKRTTRGSTRKPAASSVKSFIMLAEEPATLAVERGRSFDFSFLSLAFLRLMAFLRPPGATEEESACGC